MNGLKWFFRRIARRCRGMNEKAGAREALLQRRAVAFLCCTVWFKTVVYYAGLRRSGLLRTFPLSLVSYPRESAAYRARCFPRRGSNICGHVWRVFNVSMATLRVRELFSFFFLSPLECAQVFTAIFNRAMVTYNNRGERNNIFRYGTACIPCLGRDIFLSSNFSERKRVFSAASLAFSFFPGRVINKRSVNEW